MTIDELVERCPLNAHWTYDKSFNEYFTLLSVKSHLPNKSAKWRQKQLIGDCVYQTDKYIPTCWKTDYFRFFSYPSESLAVIRSIENPNVKEVLFNHCWFFNFLLCRRLTCIVPRVRTYEIAIHSLTGRSDTNVTTEFYRVVRTVSILWFSVVFGRRRRIRSFFID